MPTLQEELLRTGEVNQAQYEHQIETFNRAERIKQQQLAYLRRITGIAERLNLNGAFVREFSSKSTNRTMRIFKELDKKNPKGNTTKCVNCKSDGFRLIPENKETATQANDKKHLLYTRFNLCIECFPRDTYAASIGMGKFKKYK